jgi:hypothetical protein
MDCGPRHRDRGAGAREGPGWPKAPRSWGATGHGSMRIARRSGVPWPQRSEVAPASLHRGL